MKLLSDQVSEREIFIILRELREVLSNSVDGDVVEFGCYIGTTSVHIQKLLLNTGRGFHVYDSFEGLPEKAKEDDSPAGEQFQPGELHAKKSQFIKNFKQAGLPLPVIHKNWFSELTQNDVPRNIAFVFLDGDYYHSIIDPLKLIWPYLQQGATVIVDDYHNEQLPGVKKALDTWAQHHIFRLKTEASLAILNV